MQFTPFRFISCRCSAKAYKSRRIQNIGRRALLACALLLALSGARAAWGNFGSSIIFNLQPFLDPTGFIATYNVHGKIDMTNPFFQNLGTNGRNCATCHQASDAMSISAAHAQARFANTHGADPLFASVDGANCPTVTDRTDAAAHSLVRQHGLIRIGLALPAVMQFTINVVHDPYGCAMVPDPVSGQMIVSVYRRPLPTTNLNFLSAIMFDGRETTSSLNSASTFQTNLIADLTHQAMDATNIHAQANPPFTLTDPRLPQMVNLELGLSTAQIYDVAAGYLGARGAEGGPFYLSQTQYHPGINDVLGADPTGAAFNSSAFNIFAPWQNLAPHRDPEDAFDRTAARKAIAAGEVIFNTHTINIRNVRGLNDNPALGGSIPGFCTSCHDTPNVGNHSVALPLDIGTSHSLAQETDPAIAAGLAQLSSPDVPVYLISGCPDPFNTAQPSGNPPVSFYTTDPGKALLSGKCSDFNRGKGPILRGLAARAPYFHNGAAKDLNQIVNFYNQRFQMNLTDDEKAQLIAFLNSL
jgi:cytochrome c peroxidase